MTWELHPKAVEGYALTLREQGQLAEAEKIAYENRKRDPLIEKLYIEILATELTKHPVGAVEPARLTRFEQVVEESRSVVGSQALGWYYYNRDTAQQANVWFKRSVAWEPIESNVLGLALSSNKLKDRAAFKAVIAEFGARFPAVEGLKKFDVVTNVAAAPARRNRSSGGGGGGGGGDSGSAQEAVALFKSGRYGDALAALDRRGGPAREDQGLGLIRGWSLYHLGQWDKAREHFAALDRRQSTRETQYGMHYARERALPPQFRAD
jgi:tetratricopeptide (TPR) repeat protein